MELSVSPRYLDFIPPIIAHRGARARAPENTMAAFYAAHDDGVTWAETDVKLTLDGVPVLMHDDELDRTTDHTGAVAGATWANLQQADAGTWFSPTFKNTRVPMLAELLAFAKQSGMRLNVELKPCPGRTRVTAMVALIEIAKLWPPTLLPPLISSFDIDALTIAAQLHPALPRGLLLDEWRDDWRDLVILTRATTLHLNAETLNPERLEHLAKARIPLLAYTVNDPARAKFLLQNGVRAIFSDDPAFMLKALA